MTTVPARPVAAMRVEVPGSSASLWPNTAMVVHDPESGAVVVRWRLAPLPDAWIWRCNGCGTRSVEADCPHKFAAALHLAERALGLTAVGVAPTTTKETP